MYTTDGIRSHRLGEHLAMMRAAAERHANDTTVKQLVADLEETPPLPDTLVADAGRPQEAIRLTYRQADTATRDHPTTPGQTTQGPAWSSASLHHDSEWAPDGRFRHHTIYRRLTKWEPE